MKKESLVVYPPVGLMAYRRWARGEQQALPFPVTEADVWLNDLPKVDTTVCQHGDKWGP